jgi:hypothetical protein
MMSGSINKGMSMNKESIKHPNSDYSDISNIVDAQHLLLPVLFLNLSESMIGWPGSWIINKNPSNKNQGHTGGAAYRRL